jgi:Putative bacterial sensory transduction regulator
MLWICIAVMLGLPLAAQGAEVGAQTGEPLPDDGVSPPEVAKVLRDAGYPADITADRSGDPMIRSSTGKQLFVVYFYQCGARLRCTSLQFTAPFRHGKVSPASVAVWNRDHRFGRAFLDFRDVAWVSMDVETSRGVTTDALRADLNRWITVIAAFETFTGHGGG